jgi:SAM-dependent methyltransferase
MHRKLFRALRNILLVITSGFALLVGLNFPYNYDRPLSQEEVRAAQDYYAAAYAKPAIEAEQGEYDTKYLRTAEWAARKFDIAGQIRAFVEDHKLSDKAVLEIGSGRGNLQEIVDNYTGLDISPNVARFYKKKFVLGSATALPFQDNSFDALWSVFVLEHVQNPEQALSEARRVVKNGGLMFWLPAWNCPPWLAQGYKVRPYSDFGLYGKAIKVTLPLRGSNVYRVATTMPVRMVRAQAAKLGPTTLRYRRLEPNYQEYWGADSDAVNSIDSHEAMLWFSSRGDECVNCGGEPIFFPLSHHPLIIRVNKG